MDAMDAGVMHVIPWMWALPEWVALGSLLTELGEVKTCLNVWRRSKKSKWRSQ